VDYNNIKERGSLPLEDEFLDALGLDDVGLKACLENRFPSKRTT
jgi:hypothetical protein